MKKLCMLLACLGLFGCATVSGVEDRTNIELGSATLYRDQWVRLSPLEVHIQPAELAQYAPNVLFIPFRVTQEMENPSSAGYAAARAVWQTWLSMRLFPAMEFTGDQTPYRRDRAVQLGRARGVDMVVGGFVTYLYAGGTAGDTQIALQVEGLDTRTGQVVWSMAQSGMMPANSKKDYAIFSVQERLPSDPLYASTKAIAIEMGKKVQNWIAGPPEGLGKFEQLDKDVHDALFPERNKVPAPRGMDEQPREERSF